MTWSNVRLGVLMDGKGVLGSSWVRKCRGTASLYALYSGVFLPMVICLSLLCTLAIFCSGAHVDDIVE